jgi:hypothetical protein
MATQPPRTFPVLFNFDWSRSEGSARFDPETSELTMRVRHGGPVWGLLADTSEDTKLMSLGVQVRRQEILPDDPRVTFLLERIDEELEAVDAIPTGRVYGDSSGVVAQPEEQWADGSDRLPNRHTTWHLIYDPERRATELRSMRSTVEMFAGIASNPARLTDAHLHALHHTLMVTAIRPLLAIWSSDPDFRTEWLH